MSPTNEENEEGDNVLPLNPTEQENQAPLSNALYVTTEEDEELKKRLSENNYETIFKELKDKKQQELINNKTAANKEKFAPIRWVSNLRTPKVDETKIRNELSRTVHEEISKSEGVKIFKKLEDKIDIGEGVEIAVKKDSNLPQIDLPTELNKKDSTPLTGVVRLSFAFVDDKGENMPEDKAVYFGVTYIDGKLADMHHPAWNKESNPPSVEIDGKIYHAKVSKEVLGRLEAELQKNREEKEITAPQPSKEQSSEEVKDLKLPYQPWFPLLSRSMENDDSKGEREFDGVSPSASPKEPNRESGWNLGRIFSPWKGEKKDPLPLDSSAEEGLNPISQNSPAAPQVDAGQHDHVANESKEGEVVSSAEEFNEQEQAPQQLGFMGMLAAFAGRISGRTGNYLLANEGNTDGPAVEGEQPKQDTPSILGRLQKGVSGILGSENRGFVPLDDFDTQRQLTSNADLALDENSTRTAFSPMHKVEGNDIGEEIVGTPRGGGKVIFPNLRNSSTPPVTSRVDVKKEVPNDKEEVSNPLIPPHVAKEAEKSNQESTVAPGAVEQKGSETQEVHEEMDSLLHTGSVRSGRELWGAVKNILPELSIGRDTNVDLTIGGKTNVDLPYQLLDEEKSEGVPDSSHRVSEEGVSPLHQNKENKADGLQPNNENKTDGLQPNVNDSTSDVTTNPMQDKETKSVVVDNSETQSPKSEERKILPAITVSEVLEKLKGDKNEGVDGKANLLSSGDSRRYGFKIPERLKNFTKVVKDLFPGVSIGRNQDARYAHLEDEKDSKEVVAVPGSDEGQKTRPVSVAEEEVVLNPFLEETQLPSPREVPNNPHVPLEKLDLDDGFGPARIGSQITSADFSLDLPPQDTSEFAPPTSTEPVVTKEKGDRALEAIKLFHSRYNKEPLEAKSIETAWEAKDNYSKGVIKDFFAESIMPDELKIFNVPAEEKEDFDKIMAFKDKFSNKDHLVFEEEDVQKFGTAVESLVKKHDQSKMLDAIDRYNTANGVKDDGVKDAKEDIEKGWNVISKFLDKNLNTQKNDFVEEGGKAKNVFESRDVKTFVDVTDQLTKEKESTRQQSESATMEMEDKKPVEPSTIETPSNLAPEVKVLDEKVVNSEVQIAEDKKESVVVAPAAVTPDTTRQEVPRADRPVKNSKQHEEKAPLSSIDKMIATNLTKLPHIGPLPTDEHDKMYIRQVATAINFFERPSKAEELEGINSKRFGTESENIKNIETFFNNSNLDKDFYGSREKLLTKGNEDAWKVKEGLKRGDVKGFRALVLGKISEREGGKSEEAETPPHLGENPVSSVPAAVPNESLRNQEISQKLPDSRSGTPRKEVLNVSEEAVVNSESVREPQIRTEEHSPNESGSEKERVNDELSDLIDQQITKKSSGNESQTMQGTSKPKRKKSSEQHEQKSTKLPIKQETDETEKPNNRVKSSNKTKQKSTELRINPETDERKNLQSSSIGWAEGNSSAALTEATTLRHQENVVGTPDESSTPEITDNQNFLNKAIVEQDARPNKLQKSHPPKDKPQQNELKPGSKDDFSVGMGAVELPKESKSKGARDDSFISQADSTNKIVDRMRKLTGWPPPSESNETNLELTVNNKAKNSGRDNSLNK